MRNKITVAIIMAVLAMGVAGCKTESTHTSEATLTTTVNGETTEYDLSGNKDAAPAEESAPEEPQEETGDDAQEEEYYDEDRNDACGYIDEKMTEVWADDETHYDISYDPDMIYVHIWADGMVSPDQLDEEKIRDEIIPEWIEVMGDWRRELDDRGLTDVSVMLQYISDSEDNNVFFSIIDQELAYLVFDEQQ